MDEPGGRGRILVVDDTPATIDIVRTALESESYEVMVAPSGEKAIRRAQLTLPDLILLDVLMAGMNGFETCRQLKAQEQTREIPVIFMTGLSSTENKVAAFDAGGVDYVAKPIEIEVLLARLRTHLALRAVRRELEAQNQRLREEILQRSRAEDEVRRLNTELERRVEERTLELKTTNEQLQEEIEERKRAEAAVKDSEKRLQQAQKMEALGTLAGGIAHDFRNILTVIMGCTELSLLEVSKDSQTHRHLIELFKAGERAADLVQQILTFSRQKEIERKPLRVGLLCQEALKMLRVSLPTTIAIEQYIDSSSGVALVDATQIHQVLMNLCGNAAHAMRDIGGVLRVSLCNVDLTAEAAAADPELAAGPYLQLSVSDTGHGMTLEVCERIFDPYFTSKAPGEGTGLGLAVVHGIVKSYGGVVKVFSTPGEGSTFQVLLPRIENGSGLEKVDDDQALPRGTERILFVDDDEAIISTCKEVLESLGYEVVVTSDGIQALAAFENDSRGFDLIVSDVVMPKMTGIELADQLLRSRPEVPIVLCSGSHDVMAHEKALSLGVRAFLKKPLVIRSLAREIRQVLDQTQ